MRFHESLSLQTDNLAIRMQETPGAEHIEILWGQQCHCVVVVDLEVYQVCKEILFGLPVREHLGDFRIIWVRAERSQLIWVFIPPKI